MILGNLPPLTQHRLSRASAVLARASRAPPQSSAARQQQPASAPLTSSSRRQQLLVLLACQLLGSGMPARAAEPAAAAEAADDLVEYVDRKEGFGVAAPRAWAQASKAGAAVLFREPSPPGAAEVGVTVTPVRLRSLDQFGTPEKVGAGLLQAERNKESTKEATMLSVSSTDGAGGQGPTYTFDYRIDTTRGRKRVLSAVAVAGGRLYIANGTLKCPAGSPAWEGRPPAVQTLQRVVQSLRVL